MALVLFAPIVATARGSIGTTTFTRSRAGAIVRRSSRPPRRTRTRTADPGNIWLKTQAYRRTQFLNTSRRWAETLTQTQRDDWAALAANTRLVNRLGEPLQPTGRSLYFRSCLAIMDPIAAPILDAPPRAVISCPPASVTWDAVNSRFDVAFIDDNFTFSEVVHIWTSGPMPKTRNVHTDPYYLHSTVETTHFPLYLTESGTGADWRLGSAYFFRFRVVLYTGGVSHLTFARALSE